MDQHQRSLVIITGGTRGIGSGIAEMFAKEGYNLILGFRENVAAAEEFKMRLLANHKKTLSLDKDLSAKGKSYQEELRIELVRGSVLNEKTIARYFEVVDEKFGGRLNVLVHNASQIYVPEGDSRHPYEIGQPKDTKYGSLLKRFVAQTDEQETLTPSSTREYVDFTLIDHYSNLYSKCLINFAERAVKRMSDDEGSIIFISSPGCNMTQTVKPGYDMPGFGKSSGEFAIRYYAKNLQPRGINANTIIPGVVNTDAWNGYLKAMGPKFGLNTREECMEFMCKKSGQKRVLEPFEIGKVATFLCGDGRCITGMSINADGGIHLG